MDQALFLDFDGTLVDIAPTPDAVQVEPGLPATLERLSDRLGGALAIVSGRSIAVLDEFLAPARLDAAGLHGLERRVGGALLPCRPDEHPTLRACIDALRIRAPAGLILEDKGCSVALHWRTAPSLADEAASLVQDCARKLGPRYRIQEGKAVLEILPASAGKGEAIRLFLDAPPYRGRQAIFIGDDRTDEGGFAAVQSAGGIGIKVGRGDTAAIRRIGSPERLRDRLSGWARSGIDLSEVKDL